MRLFLFILAFVSLGSVISSAQAQDINNWYDISKSKSTDGAIRRDVFGRIINPKTTNTEGFFSNSRDLNLYFAQRKEATPMSDAEIRASLAEDGMMLKPPKTNNRVGIDLRK